MMMRALIVTGVRQLTAMTCSKMNEWAAQETVALFAWQSFTAHPAEDFHCLFNPASSSRPVERKRERLPFHSSG